MDVNHVLFLSFSFPLFFSFLPPPFSLLLVQNQKKKASRCARGFFFFFFCDFFFSFLLTILTALCRCFCRTGLQAKVSNRYPKGVLHYSTSLLLSGYSGLRFGVLGVDWWVGMSVMISMIVREEQKKTKREREREDDLLKMTITCT